MKSKFNFKLSHKLSIVLVVALLGFLVAGAEYAALLNEGKNFEKTTASLTQFGETIELIRRDLLESMRLEKEFAYSGDIDLIPHFEEKMTDAREYMARLEILLPAGSDLKLVHTLQELFRNYHGEFYTMAESHVHRGLAIDAGARGKLRAAKIRLEQALEALHEPRLLGSMQKLTDYAADFIESERTALLTQKDLEIERLQKAIARLNIAQQTRTQVLGEVDAYQAALDNYVSNISQVRQSEEVLKDRANQIQPLFSTLVNTKNEYMAKTLEQVESQRDYLTYFFGATMILVALAIGGTLFWFAQGMMRSLRRLHATVNQVSAGDYAARTGTMNSDELGQLGRAFDQLLDERVSHLARAEQENEQLNESIIRIMGAVSRLSRNDLTVEVPVSEDVTGAVADAINLMASEAASVLNSVQSTAREVQFAAVEVEGLGISVSESAATEQALVEDLMTRLGDASKTMKGIAGLAKKCNDFAAVASGTTHQAFSSVHSSAEGMNGIRETVNETGKRIKRLGERSQEITEIVNVIKDIADKTDGLAINASMQAAAAGDAGRGFSVVAEQVQRLAQSASESSAMIASLVKTIQTETADAMAVTNKAIDQVVIGSQLADRSGNEMRSAQEQTERLLGAVNKIAQYSIAQARQSDELHTKAGAIQRNTVQTGKAIEEQTAQTKKLVGFAKLLQKAIGVFKLPAHGGYKEESAAIAMKRAVN